MQRSYKGNTKEMLRKCKGTTKELLRKYYLEQGFADFRVLSAVAELSHDRSSFFITFTVEEGELYKFGQVKITSTLKDLDPNSLLSNLTVIADETYNAEEIERTISKLNFAIGQLGYAFVDIRPRVKRHKDDQIIDLVFEIFHTPQVVWLLKLLLFLLLKQSMID